MTINKTFLLKEGQDFVQLNNLLQVFGIAQTGGHAKILILNEEINVNGRIETRIRKKLFSDDVIQFENVLITIKNKVNT